MNKKRGFTIVEVIIAIAVFAIVTASVSLVVNTSSNLYKQETVKFETISAANALLEQLRAQGTRNSTKTDDNITSLQDLFVDKYGSNTYLYIYFDYEESTDLSKLPLKYSSYTIEGAEGDYNVCYGNNISHKNFGAYIHISRTAKANGDTTNLEADSYYDNYNIDVEVWKLSDSKPENTLAKASASISR